MKNRAYCAVDGCKSRKLNENLSFFGLPKEEERRKKWLELIGRPDLISPSTKARSHSVCSLHFDASLIKYIPQLRADAVPSKSLPNGPSTSDAYTDTEYIDISTPTKKSRGHILSTTNKGPYTKSSCIQTDSNNTKNEVAQTLQDISSDTSRKRKLCSQIQESDQEKRNFQQELNKIIKTQSKESESHQSLSFNSEDKVTKRLVRLLEWRSNLKNRSKGNRYDPEYILFALNLHFSSPQTYRCLKNFFQLPSENTLQKFNMVIPVKFEHRISNFLSAKLKSLPENAKYCILCIDEMVLKRQLYYDTKRDELYGLQNINGEVTKEIASNACVIMLRGIVVNWKQPIAYSFLASPTHYKELEEWLDEVILKLSNIGIEINAIVSDQDSNFDKYAKEVKRITVEKPYFLFQERKIYHIFDVPHLFKCIRNDLLTNDFIYDGQRITWKYVEELYEKQKEKNLKLIPKVTDKHIRPNNFQKMQVKYATQIFNRSVFAAINVLVSNQNLPREALHTADFIEKMNNVFDVLNSSKVSCSNKYQKAFSMRQYQIDVLKEAELMFAKIQTIDNKKGVNNTNINETFKNIQITIRAIMMLTKDLQEKGIHFLFTRRLSQDPLETFFAAVRQHGNINRPPTPIQFQRAFSKLFIRNMLQNSRFSNCKEDICQMLQKSDTLLEQTTSSELERRLPSAVVLNGDTDYQFDLPSKSALTYLSGYLLYKCSKKHNCAYFDVLLEKCPNFNETSLYTHFKEYNKDSSFYGELKVPTDNFNIYIEELENIFLDNFFKVLINRPGSSIYEKLKLIDNPPLCSCFPYEYLLKLFTRFRIFATIKFNNREFREGNKAIHHFIKLKHV